jgi:hypothetical protein
MRKSVLFITFYLILLVTACGGTSLHTLHMLQASFEHCITIDNSDVDACTKLSCWDMWLTYCNYDELADYTKYAIGRVHALRPGCGLL